MTEEEIKKMVVKSMAKCVGVFMEGNSDLLPIEESFRIALNAILANISLSSDIKWNIQQKVREELE